ncbi:hypothetical protein G7046_g944 [Stylonectria norvegica]|nr:hypothetical protein G7046_g944 [Stylonectria norvegica]
MPDVSSCHACPNSGTCDARDTDVLAGLCLSDAPFSLLQTLHSTNLIPKVAGGSFLPTSLIYIVLAAEPNLYPNHRAQSGQEQQQQEKVYQLIPCVHVLPTVTNIKAPKPIPGSIEWYDAKISHVNREAETLQEETEEKMNLYEEME